MTPLKTRLRWYSSLLISALYCSAWFTQATPGAVAETLYLFVSMFGLCTLVWYLVVHFQEIPFFIPRAWLPVRRSPWSLANNRSLLAAVGFMLLSYRLYAYLADGKARVDAWLGFQDEGLLVAILIRYVNYTYDLLNHYRQVQLDNEQLLRENLNAQFEVLKQQIAPHFLFNSLNTLKSLVRRQHPAAEEYVRNLSAVYRYLLQQRTADVATLADELRFLDAYVYLQQMRFGAGFQVRIDVPEAARTTLIPPMALQMLVENALKHNVVSAGQPLCIDITATADHLVVRNNRQPKLTREPSTGLGLENINNRYLHLAGNPIDVQPGEAYFAVSLPLLTPHHERIAAGR
jgi:hypothetical protein